MFACRDSTPHKTCPANLRGLKPVTAEPWAYDAQVYAEKTGSFERVVNADMFGTGSTKLEEYNDESIYDSNNPDEVRAIGSRTTSLSERSVQESPIHMSMTPLCMAACLYPRRPRGIAQRSRRLGSRRMRALADNPTGTRRRCGIALMCCAALRP